MAGDEGRKVKQVHTKQNSLNHYKQALDLSYLLIGVKQILQECHPDDIEYLLNEFEQKLATLNIENTSFRFSHKL